MATALITDRGVSREEIVRRFDHEVQGRTLRKPFAGKFQSSPQDGSLMAVPEADAFVALGHGVAPIEENIFIQVLTTFDEAMKKFLLATGQLGGAGLLDNYSWPDPLNNARSLWKLAVSGELLKIITEVTGLPFISGKDSMKNNSADYRIPETLVLSAIGSAVGPDHMPSGFFLKSEQKVFYWPPVDLTELSAAKKLRPSIRCV